jgi:hypothetical protein
MHEGVPIRDAFSVGVHSIAGEVRGMVARAAGLHRSERRLEARTTISAAMIYSRLKAR